MEGARLDESLLLELRDAPLCKTHTFASERLIADTSMATDGDRLLSDDVHVAIVCGCVDTSPAPPT